MYLKIYHGMKGTDYLPFKHQSHKMVKHTQTIRRHLSTNCLRVFNHFVKLPLKGLTCTDKLKYKDFISDPDAHIKNTQIINFEIIHAQCRGQPRTHSDKYFQTVTCKDVKKMPEKD